MRWRQCAKTGKFIPIDEAAARSDHAAGKANNIIRDFEPFRSPVDGSLIRNHRDLAEHNKRNNVVNVAEFDDGHYRQREAERRKLYNNELTAKEKLARRQELYERIISKERQNGY